ncbi:hypothetical protein [Vibrio owensii]|uniref:hypothetical protein n=1 Tax=Vibrio owensii TaxID=696485 RepID=UPI00406934FC
MADIATLSTALASIKTAIDLAKVVKDSDLTLEKAETKLRLADLLSSLADAKMEMVEVQELVGEKDKRIKELESSLLLKSELVRFGDAMYKKGNSGEAKGVPYCLNCWTQKHQIFPLYQSTSNVRFLACGSCKSHFDKRRTPPK